MVNPTPETIPLATTSFDQREELALELAQKLASCAPHGRAFPIPGRLKKLDQFFKSTYHYFEESTRAKVVVSHAAEWLLDNFYVVEQAIRQVEEDMPASYYRRLPKTRDGWARIQILAIAIMRHENIMSNIHQIKNFVQTFQDVTPLSVGELWALPLMLRLVVIETLAEGLAKITKLNWPIAGVPGILRGMEVADSHREPASDSPQPADETTVINCILNLRLLATQDWKSFFESTSILEKILSDDPVDAYAGMDFETRNYYRNVIEELADGSSFDEASIASQVVELAQAGGTQRKKHVGYHLIGQGRAKLEEQLKFRPRLRMLLERWLLKHATFNYLGGIIGLTALIWFAVINYAFQTGDNLNQIILGAFLTLLPVSSIAIELINWMVVGIVTPHALPKMDFQKGVPTEYSTMVVIPALLSTEKDVTFLTRQLENHFLSNTDPNIHFALLTDFADAPKKEMSSDGELVEQAKNAIKGLNKKYGSNDYQPFYFFHRERTWNAGEECWMGWERKRGKLEEFNDLLRSDKSTTYIVQFGDLSVMSKVCFVITLDADTQLPRESAHRLIGALAHPLNRAELDPSTGRIMAGHTILQPKTQVRPTVANQSLFTRIYSGDSAIDLYSRAVSDVYQDLFGEGNFVGKGIYDVDAFRASLQDLVPENRLLSHDLFEGIQGRCGLETDVVLFEDYPPHYLTYESRLHRWLRGDWQLISWLAPYVPHRVKGKIRNPLSLIDRWKILDNLRRSLIPVISLSLLIAGLLALPGLGIIWAGLALSPFLISIITNFISGLFNITTGQIITRPLRLSAMRSLVEIIVLPHEALVTLDAILTTLIRMFITHKRMLQWTTAAHTVQIFGKKLKVEIAWREMIFGPLLAFTLTFVILAANPDEILIASPLLIGWTISPFIASWMSQPITYPVQKLSYTEERKLHLLARATWLYFEHFVGPDDHWLPPDHFQESPIGFVAHRTSPTNIGMMFTSTLSAHDLGYIGSQELLLRVRDALDSMDSLERVRGHFLNWYDTRTLAPLSPRYVSTVDSGNLAACLLVLRQGCGEISRSAVVNWDGLLDTLSVLLSTLEEARLDTSNNDLHKAISRLYDQIKLLSDSESFTPSLLTHVFHDGPAEMENLLLEAIQSSSEEIAPDLLHSLSVWMERVRYHLRFIQNDLQTLSPWLLMLSSASPLFDQPDLNPELKTAYDELLTKLSFCPLIGQIADISKQAGLLTKQIIELLDKSNSDELAWFNTLAEEIESARKNSTSLLKSFSALAARAEDYFQTMNFTFLFNSQRKVFHIGYNVESSRLDANYYDLLASEARISSLVAIARGDVPQSHWLHLARPLTQINETRTLLSWSGTMFEYLMPILFAASYPNTLLEQSCHAAVEEQIRYATEKKVPWGISEAGYHNFDTSQAYQYQAFGIPSLGYKRGLSESLVITPYASILALPYEPQMVMQNLEKFAELKMWGLYGLYESVDFTSEHLKTGEDFAIIRSFMVHHQGMILLSLSNHLLDKRMVRRFHKDQRIESIELLLQEQTPVNAPTEHPPPQQLNANRGTYSTITLDPWRVRPDAPYTQVHCLSNGKYSLLITAAGAGYSRWSDIELTRWSPDSTLDDRGSWIYVEDRLNGQVKSVTDQPLTTPPDRSEVLFFPHKAEFERQDGDIVLHTSVSIAPDDDVELRRVTITNQGDRHRIFDLTSYSEIILSPRANDQRHPAFNKLFIDSEFLQKEQILLFRRRPRSADEKHIYLAHFFTSEHEQAILTGYETDRSRFLGRGGTPQRPIIFSNPVESSMLSRTSGSTLDPIAALQVGITLEPYEKAQITFVTLAAGSRKEAIELAQRYHRRSQLKNAIDGAQIQAEEEFVQLELTSRDVEWIQKLLSPLLYPSPSLRGKSTVLTANTLGQPGLWSFAISGDYPILLVRLKNEENLDLLNQVLLAHTYWRKRGLMIDLVILNQRPTSYDRDFHTKIFRLLDRTNSETWVNKRGGIFIIREDQMAEAERILLETVARVILEGEAGQLQQQLTKLDVGSVQLPRFVPIEPSALYDDAQSIVERPTDLLFDNGLGGFTPDGHEYIIYLERNQWTPAPWINVIATPQFGCLVSEAGMGCSWAQNSGENRLTPWRNDPIGDEPSEAVYLRDEDSGEIWSPTPLPARADAPYLIRHGAGYSIFEHASHGLEQNLRIFAVPHEPIKLVQLKLHNTTSRVRRISATYYAEWVLGSLRENTTPYIVPEFASNHFALLARNTYNLDFGQHVAFLASTREPNGVTTDRTEFLGKHGSYTRPAALERVGLTPRIQSGTDPCAVLQVLLWLQPGETKEVTFLLGQGTDRTDAERLITQYQSITNVESAWNENNEFWKEHLEQIQVKTPDIGMDLLLNRWLLYQSLTGRFWGRTGFYQSSGAYGYRDQLQDVMAYIHVRPDMVRKFILEAASHQFEEGDVLHWWHPPFGRGVRTRCSDDLIWLPFVTAHYVNTTGDLSILHEPITFLSAEPLRPGEDERYGQFPSSIDIGTLYEHCCRALVKGVTAGPHGIPLMGAHDWNDGMNRVGSEGKGESIWLGWFLHTTLKNFADICELISESQQAIDFRAQADSIRVAIESHGWDEEWYLRAFYDDGSPLGSSLNNECKIDSIAQSWSVISKAGDPERAKRAMESVYERLVRFDDELVLLFTPPFDRTARNPGYIKGYPVGIRENGGQYTHAALWAIWALAELGQNERAMELFRLINPIYHTDTPAKADRYRVEPYVIAADVYSTSPHNGRGGWTWYTGSASWMYRLGIERLLGITRVGDSLQINPGIPMSWPSYEVDYRFGKTTYHIRVENSKDIKRITVDGKELTDMNISLIDDGEKHEIMVALGELL